MSRLASTPQSALVACPTIACINRATVPLGIDMDKMIGALQTQLTRDYAPVYGDTATLVKASDQIRGAWGLEFWDDADQPGALAYHDVTAGGLPLSKVFVRTIQKNGESVSAAASHELLEMKADPYCNSAAWDQKRNLWVAWENADPDEEAYYKINGIDVSNFVFPEYFSPVPRGTQIDYLSRMKKPFQILKGGYQSVFKGGRWSEIFGSAAKWKRFAKEDRRGHRSELRRGK